MITIVYGPKASGKTLNKELIKAHLNCARIVDDWMFNRPLQDGDLALTFCHPHDNGHFIVGLGDVRLVSITNLYALPGFVRPKNFAENA